MSERTRTGKRILVTMTLPLGAWTIGVVLLLVCLAAPLYAAGDVLTIARLITGFYGALFVCVGIVGTAQRSKSSDAPEQSTFGGSAR